MTTTISRSSVCRLEADAAYGGAIYDAWHLTDVLYRLLTAGEYERVCQAAQALARLLAAVEAGEDA